MSSNCPERKCDDLTARSFNNITELDNPEKGTWLDYCKNSPCSKLFHCMMDRMEYLTLKSDTNFWRMIQNKKIDALVKLSKKEITAEQYRDEMIFIKSLKNDYTLRKKN